MKLKLIIIILILSTGVTLYHFTNTTKLLDDSLKTLDNTPLKEVAKQVQSIQKKIVKEKNNKELKIDLNKIAKDVESEAIQMSTQIQTIKKHTNNILGTATQSTQEDTSLSEKALEYGKYLYCKSVVNEYEKITK